MEKFQETVGFGKLEERALKIPEKREKEARELLLKAGWKQTEPSWLFIPPMDKYIYGFTDTGYPGDCQASPGWCTSKETKKLYYVCPLTQYLVRELRNIEPPSPPFSEYGYHTPNGIVAITKKGWEEIKEELNDAST